MNNETRSHVWKKLEQGATPTSTALIPEFVSVLQDYCTDVDHRPVILDIGGAHGRVASQLQQALQVEVLVSDLNLHEIFYGSRTHTSLPFVAADACHMPFQNERVDVALFCGVLGAMDQDHRIHAMTEATRLVRPGGLVYVADFARNDRDETTSKGIPWEKVYAEQAQAAGEFGSTLIMNPNGKVKAIGHHFLPKELATLYYTAGLQVFGMKEVMVQSMVSRQARRNYAMWGIKQ